MFDPCLDTRRDNATAFSMNRRQAGFSLLLIMLILAFIAMMAATSISISGIAQRRLAENELLYIGQQWQVAFQRYAVATPSGAAIYPHSLRDLLRDPRFSDTQRYLRKIFIDPMTGKDDWVLIRAANGGIMGVHSAATGKPFKKNDFPAGMESFAHARSYSDWQFFYKPSSAGKGDD